MLKSIHADILNKPFSQIKELKLHYPDDIDSIKQNHKSTWDIFKNFILSIYQNLPNNIAKPHVESWCNGWQIRNHYFAYFKDKNFIQNAPIISILLNKKRFIIQLDWHAYKAKTSKSTLQRYHNWLNEIDIKNFDGFYFYKNTTSEYDDFMPIYQFDINNLMDDLMMNDKDWYKLAFVIKKEDLDDYQDKQLIDLSVNVILKLMTVYYHCQSI